MKKLSYLVAVMSILMQLGFISIIFNMGILPYTDKCLFLSLFTGLFLFGLYAYLVDSKSEVVYFEHHKKIRKSKMRGMLLVMICTSLLIGLTLVFVP